MKTTLSVSLTTVSFLFFLSFFFFPFNIDGLSIIDWSIHPSMVELIVVDIPR